MGFKEIGLEAALLVLLLYASIAAETPAQPVSPAKPPPEIVALMPSGNYVGHAVRAGKRLDMTLAVLESKPGGRFSGTVILQRAQTPCGGVFPMRGTLEADGDVHIESKAGVPRECQRTLVLKLAGDDLNGTLMGSQEDYQIRLKKQ